MYDTYVLLKTEGIQFPPINENIDGILLETPAVKYIYCKLLRSLY
jgi:growth factor-regulated tyrosine kinase substrate